MVPLAHDLRKCDEVMSNYAIKCVSHSGRADCNTVQSNS